MKPKTILGGYIIRDAPATEKLDNPKQSYAQVKRWANRDREHLVAIYVDARSRMIAREVVSIGTLTASLVHPREVFKGALLHNAAAVIVAHNHPSGDVRPSTEDRDATRRLAKAGELLGVPMLDHIIIGRGGQWWSFKDHGEMP